MGVTEISHWITLDPIDQVRPQTAHWKSSGNWYQYRRSTLINNNNKSSSSEFFTPPGGASEPEALLVRTFTLNAD